MSEPPDPDHGEPSVLVQVTPSSYRVQAVVFVGVGVLFLAGSTGLTLVTGHRLPSPLLPLAGIVYGVYCAVRAHRQVTYTALRIDRAGLRTGDGRHDHDWTGVTLVWVGSSSGLRLPVVIQPVLHVYTEAGVDFARRAGTRPQPRYTLPVGGRWRVPALCDQLRRVSDARIVDGTTVSRRTVASSLLKADRG